MGRTILLVILLKLGYGLLTMAFVFGGSEILINLSSGLVKKLAPAGNVFRCAGLAGNFFGNQQPMERTLLYIR